MVDESARNKIEELLEKGESVFRWNIGSYKDFNEMAMFEEIDEIKSDFILNSLY